MISKTLFKNYIRCARFAGLFKIKTEAHPIVSVDDVVLYEKNALVLELKDNMQLIEYQDTMLEYYNILEKYAAQKVKKQFNHDIRYGLNTKDQKMIHATFRDYEYLSFLDGFYQGTDYIEVYETKATTTEKIDKLSYTIKKVNDTIYEKIDNVYYLKEELNKDMLKNPKYLACRKKLFDFEHEFGKYIYDIAFERFVFEHSKEASNINLNKCKYYLCVINKDFIYQADDNYDDLISFVDVSNITKEMQDMIQNDALKVEDYLNKLDVGPCRLSKSCSYKGNNPCEFVNICFKDFDFDGSIFDLLDRHHGFVDEINSYSIYDLANQGYKSILDVQKMLTRENNIIQHQVIMNHKRHINIEKISAALKTLQYPLYYLDFEAFNCPIPRFQYEKPYAQSLFQFSLHIEKEEGVCDFDHDHYGYLAKNKEDCRYELAKKLCSLVGDEGSVIVYNKAFENTRLKELSLLYQDLKDKLLSISNRLFDLLDVVKTNKVLYQNLGFSDELAKEVNIYDKSMRGSYSIKKILPLVSDLSYEQLKIQNGCMAMDTYHRFDKMTDKEFLKEYEHLVSYCKLDTYSMVLIMHYLHKICL